MAAPIPAAPTLDDVLHVECAFASLLATARARTMLPDSELSKVRAVVLPPELEEWAQQYKEAGGKRSSLLWQWLYHGTQMTQLPNVRADLAEPATHAKWLINMLNVIMDDVSDEDRDMVQVRHCEQLWQDSISALEAPEAGATVASAGDVERSGNSAPVTPMVELGKGGDAGHADRELTPKLRLCRRLIEDILRRLAVLPRFRTFVRMLEFDVGQMLNEKGFSAMINAHNFVLNTVEHSMYAPHTMHGSIFLTVDLMAAPAVPLEHVGPLRAVFWLASTQANVANCLATWPREVPARDWSSPIFVRGLEAGVFSLADLQSLPAEEISKRVVDGGLEDVLLREWREAARKMLRYAPCAESVDVRAFLGQNLAFLLLHVGCRGFI